MQLESWLVPYYEKFRASVVQGRAPSSLIIAGDPLLNLASLAVHCARLYLCMNRVGESECNECKSCHLFSDLYENTHPDFISLVSSTAEDSRDELDLTHSFAALFRDMGTPLTEGDEPEDKVRSVRVDGVRRLNEWITQGSVLGHGKVAVISNAHLLGESAANALLKTFEEPSSDTLIILLTKSLDALPATILSRGVKVEIAPVKQGVGEEYLKTVLKDEFDSSRALCALTLSYGSPLKAVKIYRQGLDRAALSIVSALGQAGTDKRHTEALIDELLALSDEDRVLILSEFIIELLKYKAGIVKDTLPLLKDQSLELVSKIPASHLFKAYNDLKFFRADDKLLASRAPIALVRAWIDALCRK